MSHSHQLLARLLCQSIEDILWQDYKSSFQCDPISLTTRVGSGRATYCQYHPAKNQMNITFGKKMLASKFNRQQAQQWLSFREIHHHKYFNGDTSLVNLLTHTVLHEFSHALQHLNREVFKGSIHNHYFYHYLDTLYTNNQHLKVKRFLLDNCQKYNISLDYQSNSETPIPPFTIKDDELKLHNAVSFKYKSKLYQGKIIRVNRKTYTVETRSWRGKAIWRIPKSMVSKTI